MSDVQSPAPASGATGTAPEQVLSVEDLRVRFQTENGIVKAVDGVSFELRKGEVLAIVGESGSGKSVTAMSLMGLTRGVNATIEGEAWLGETNLIAASDDDLRTIRGEELAMIFQDPMSSLNPVYKVGPQITEMIHAHREISKRDARARGIELMESVGIPDAESRFEAYPHEFSGGMRQRVMIAMALALDPGVLIADEPTTALDVTIQAQILRLIQQLNKEQDVATILITHDLGVVAEVADRVVVMYGGRVVETGTVDQIFYEPQHPYTWGLLGSVTRLDQPSDERLVQIKGQPPSLVNPPAGCHFKPRCPFAFEKCGEVPPLEAHGSDPTHTDRCWLPEQARSRHRAELAEQTGTEIQ